MVIFGVVVLVINAVRNNSRRKALAAISLSADRAGEIIYAPVLGTEETGIEASVEEEGEQNNNDEESEA